MFRKLSLLDSVVDDSRDALKSSTADAGVGTPHRDSVPSADVGIPDDN